MIQTVCHGSMDFWISFLVFETSSYGKGQAYDQLVSEFVSCVKGPKIGNNCAFLTKVRHSQRMNDPCVTL